MAAKRLEDGSEYAEYDADGDEMTHVKVAISYSPVE
tara:strand:- start:1559 stop:1666 length:108 start_codon:yes stop_codon:yes gene_type:complete